MSTNNIYYNVDTVPVMRYRKTVAHSLSGWRIDPITGKQVDFILTSAPLPRDYKYEDLPKMTFKYEYDVVELYSDKEVNLFRRLNRTLFENGLLQEYEGEPEATDFSNMMSDADVIKIAVLPPIKLQKRLTEITSDVTLHRILAMAQEIGRPAKVITTIEQRQKELQQKHLQRKEVLV